MNLFATHTKVLGVQNLLARTTQYFADQFTNHEFVFRRGRKNAAHYNPG